MEDLLRNTLIALIEANLTLVDLPQFLTNENFRLNAIKQVKHPITKAYFERFNKLQGRTRDEWMESTLNKVNAFLSDDRIREMFAYKKSSINLREIMDSSQILLLKLDRGRLKENADLIGSLFMTKLKLAAFSRSEIPKEQRAQFYLYIDEFQNFASKTFIELLSESRKYGLSLTLAHQNLTQLPEDLQDSILTNCGIQVSFRASRKDAERLSKEFFQTTGKEIKESKFSPTAAIDHKYYSYQEEWEYYFQAIQTLPPRCFFVKHKIEGGILPLQAETIAPAFELAGLSQQQHKEAIQNSHFGLKYLSIRGKPQLQLEGTEEINIQPEAIQEKPKPQKAQKPVSEQPEAITLEEITATLTPLEKAMIWAIGTGNYQASDIYEEGNKRLKEWAAPTKDYSEFKNNFYTLSKHPPEGKGLIEFSKRGKNLFYWLSPWGEIAFSEKFNMPSDRAINELGGGGKAGKAVSLEIIKEWLEPEGYSVKKEDEIETDLNDSERGYTDLVAEKDGECLRIEIENRTDKDQIEKNIRKNLEYTNTLYEIASDQTAKSKLIQVALKTMFRLRKEKPDKDLVVKISTIDELKQCNFKEWFEVANR